MNRYGVPKNFNTDQGAQFSLQVFTQVFKTQESLFSWTAKGAGRTTSSAYALLGSVRWVCLYLKELETGSQTRRAFEHWGHFNEQRFVDVYREETASLKEA
ncbi:MAG: hypothetical protein HY795_16300 [Desulfovibrio sp.]|nr:hypothetical protein [Desulfovibrio sp.]MBI4959188.1 hypothetical protein [Desulfovibrio sp.]